jgi:hypothetical protein
MGLCVKCRFISWMCLSIIRMGLSDVCRIMFGYGFGIIGHILDTLDKRTRFLEL